MVKWRRSKDKKGKLASANQEVQEAEDLPDILRTEAPELCNAIKSFRDEVSIWSRYLMEQKELHRKWESHFFQFITPNEVDSGNQ